jgi:RNA polymerase sigma factor (TIGR02999 family)
MEPTISSLIASAEGGDRSAADALFAALYSELHRLARRQLSKSAPGLTLGTTTLLHEAYLQVAQREGTVFPDRGRFMAYAARVMRGLIIDYWRGRQARKRGGEFTLLPLADEVGDPSADDEDLTASAKPSTSSPAWIRSSPRWWTSSSSAGSPSPRSPPCAACRSAPCSGAGTRRASTCTA